MGLRSDGPHAGDLLFVAHDEHGDDAAHDSLTFANVVVGAGTQQRSTRKRKETSPLPQPKKRLRRQGETSSHDPSVSLSILQTSMQLRGIQPPIPAAPQVPLGVDPSSTPAQPLPPHPLPPLSALHNEIMAFAASALPLPEEAAAVAAAVRIVDEAARATFPGARAALFGSQVRGRAVAAHATPTSPQPTGLALPNSDLDVVVLTSDGQQVVDHSTTRLRRLLQHLQAGGHVPRGGAQIIHARVPIIKCTMHVGLGGSATATLCADIAMDVRNGSDAVHFVTRQLHVRLCLLPWCRHHTGLPSQAMHPLRPLVLVIKAFLKEACLNEVFTGGLSSFSLTMMVLAHLQAEVRPFDHCRRIQTGVAVGVFVGPWRHPNAPGASKP